MRTALNRTQVLQVRVAHTFNVGLENELESLQQLIAQRVKVRVQTRLVVLVHDLLVLVANAVNEQHSHAVVTVRQEVSRDILSITKLGKSIVKASSASTYQV